MISRLRSQSLNSRGGSRVGEGGWSRCLVAPDRPVSKPTPIDAKPRGTDTRVDRWRAQLSAGAAARLEPPARPLAMQKAESSESSMDRD
jgi:hypothetical protein